MDRKDWRLVGLVHAAETREQAYKDVEHGIEQWFRYFEGVAAFPQMGIELGEHPKREMVDFVNTSGVGAIGTLGGRVRRRSRSSRRRATAGSARTSCSPTSGPTRRRRSAPTSSSPSTSMPIFQGHAQPTIDARARASATHGEMSKTQNDAVAHMTAKYEQEVAASRG